MKGCFYEKRREYATLTNNDPDIVVINYKMLTDKLAEKANNATYKGWLSNLTGDYQQGGLEGIFEAFDSATTLNPNSGSTYFNHTYTYSADMDLAALQCADDIDDSISLLNNIRLTADRVLIKKIKQAIYSYETTMANMSSVYTNLEAAYKAYLVAVECYDAYTFGNKRDFAADELANVYNNLITAISAMQPWTRATANAVPYFSGSNIAAMEASASGYYGNVLYTSGVGTSAFHYKHSGNYVVIDAIFAPTTVLMYDGNTTPKMPVMVGIRWASSSSRNNRYFSTFYSMDGNQAQNTLVQNPTFYFENQYWKFSSTSYSGGPDALNANFVQSLGDDWSSSTVNAWAAKASGSGDFAGSTYRNKSLFGSNALKFTGNSETFGDNYYLDITPYFGAYWDTSNASNPGYYQAFVPGSTYYYDSGSTTYNNKVYIVNYKPFLDKMNANDDLLLSGIDVSDYKEGGLKTYFKEMDALTSFSFSTYFADGKTISTEVGNFNTAMNALLNTTTSHLSSSASGTEDIISNAGITTDTKTDDPFTYDDNGNIATYPDYEDATTAYTKLKVAILEAKKAPSSQGCIKSAIWSDFNTKLATAISEMYDVGTDDSTYSGKGGYPTDVTTIADNLHNAYNALYAFANSEHALKYSYKEPGTHNYYFQCSTNNSHVLYHDEDEDKDETVISADGTVYDQLGLVYSTLDLSKYSSTGQNTIATGKAAYDAMKTAAHTAGDSPDDIIDDANTALLTAINEANTSGGGSQVNDCAITFELYKADDGTQVGASDTTTYGSVKYGQVTEITANRDAVFSAISSAEGKEVNASNLVIQKWEIVVGGATRTVFNSSNSYPLSVQSNATVKAYYSIVDTSEQIKVTINGIDGNAHYTFSAGENDAFIIDGANVTIGETTYSVPNTVNYAVWGWYPVGTFIYASLDTTVGAHTSKYGLSELKLNPMASLKTAVTNNDPGYIKLDGSIFNGYDSVTYDTHVRVSNGSANVYGLVIAGDSGKYIPIAYGTSYEWFFNRSLDIYTLYHTDADGYYIMKNGAMEKITDETTVFFFDRKLPMSYDYLDLDSDYMTNASASYTVGGESITVSTYSRITTRSAFTAGTDVTITEAGTLRALDQSYSENEMVIENVGKDGYSIATVAATTVVEPGKQYSYTAKTSKTAIREVQTRSYVKFTYTYNNKTIDAIAYGPLCTGYIQGSGS